MTHEKFQRILGKGLETELAQVEALGITDVSVLHRRPIMSGPRTADQTARPLLTSKALKTLRVNWAGEGMGMRPRTEIPAPYPRFSDRGGETIVTLRNSRGASWVGKARCSESDTFSRPAGRRIALQRAIAMVSGEGKPPLKSWSYTTPIFSEKTLKGISEMAAHGSYHFSLPRKSFKPPTKSSAKEDEAREAWNYAVELKTEAAQAKRPKDRKRLLSLADAERGFAISLYEIAAILREGEE